jgi:hypothetical protein
MNTAELSAAEESQLLRIAANPNLRIKEIVVCIPTTKHSCDAQCGVVIERGEPCVSLRVDKPTGSFCRYWHLSCAPAEMQPEIKPLRQDRALRYLAQTFAKKKRTSDVPKAAWCVLTAILVEANS